MLSGAYAGVISFKKQFQLFFTFFQPSVARAAPDMGRRWRHLMSLTRSEATSSCMIHNQRPHVSSQVSHRKRQSSCGANSCLEIPKYIKIMSKYSKTSKLSWLFMIECGKCGFSLRLVPQDWPYLSAMLLAVALEQRGLAALRAQLR